MVNSFISYQVDDINIHLEHAATWGRAAGGVGAEEDEVGQQNRHLGEHMDDFYIGRMGDHV